MKLSDGVEAAIHCVAVMAGIPEQSVMPASALAEHHGLSSSYLLKHLKTLVASGILESVPGPSGGYRLARNPEDITLLDIVLAVEGDEPAFRCREIRQKGPCRLDASAFPKPCGIKRAMLRAEDAYRAALAATRLSDIVTEFTGEADPRVLQKGQDFIDRNHRPQSH